MSPACFDVVDQGPVVHLRLNRPDERNTLLPAFWSELPSVVRQIDRTGRARVLVLSSTGRHFSAGLDLSVLEGGGMFGDPRDAETGRRRALVYDGIRSLHEAFTALEETRLPVLAAVQGGCVGGAVALAAACDLRWASADAFFLLQEVNLAITPDVGQLQRLPRLMPEAVVKEMAYRGTRLQAARAHEVGFLNGVFDDHDALVAGVLEIAHAIAGKSPLAVWGAKKSVAYARDHTVEDGLDQIALWQAAMYHRTESLEAMVAEREGRVPEYDDLLGRPGD